MCSVSSSPSTAHSISHWKGEQPPKGLLGLRVYILPPTTQSHSQVEHGETLHPPAEGDSTCHRVPGYLLLLPPNPAYKGSVLAFPEKLGLSIPLSLPKLSRTVGGLETTLLASEQVDLPHSMCSPAGASVAWVPFAPRVPWQPCGTGLGWTQSGCCSWRTLILGNPTNLKGLKRGLILATYQNSISSRVFRRDLSFHGL